jgi:hypothetical protein
MSKLYDLIDLLVNESYEIYLPKIIRCKIFTLRWLVAECRKGLTHSESVKINIEIDHIIFDLLGLFCKSSNHPHSLINIYSQIILLVIEKNEHTENMNDIINSFQQLNINVPFILEMKSRTESNMESKMEF